MKRRAAIFIALAMFGHACLSAQPSLERGSVLEAAERLKAGEFLWAPAVAPEGPVMLVISLATQRAVLYRNGVPIAISTVSTGRPGHRTPTGVFTVLQRQVEHYSSLYNGAPVPYMQRLTWGGVALHGGHLPGYPASHGYIRLPHEFARLLYGVTRLGMTVVVTNEVSVPRVAPADPFRSAATAAVGQEGSMTWRPERSRSGPVSIIISVADRRAIVLRNGVVIGSAPVAVAIAIEATSVFMLQEGPERRWLRIALPGQGLSSLATDLRGRIQVAAPFRTAVQAIAGPGTTVVITRDSVRSGGRRSITVVEADAR